MLESILWDRAQPQGDTLAWTIANVLGWKVDHARRHQQIASARFRLLDDLDAQDQPTGALPYLNRWNACRRDLQIDALMLMVGDDLPDRTVEVSSLPTGDVAQWLLDTVLGLGDVRFEDELQRVVRAALPICRRMRFSASPALDAFHRSRYLVLRFYADAVLHVV